MTRTTTRGRLATPLASLTAALASAALLAGCGGADVALPTADGVPAATSADEISADGEASSDLGGAGADSTGEGSADGAGTGGTITVSPSGHQGGGSGNGEGSGSSKGKGAGNGNGSEDGNGNGGVGQGKGKGSGHGGGNGKGKGGDHGQNPGEDPGDGTPGEVELPAGWAGTISAETLEPSNGISYLYVSHLYGDLHGVQELDLAVNHGSMFLAEQGAECEGVATIAGDSATCMVVPDAFADPYEQERIPAEVRLVPTAFGGSALLISVNADGRTDLAISAGVEIAQGKVDPYLGEDPTAEDMERAVISGVSYAAHPDGDLPAEIAASCTMLDGGAHAICELTGTEDGGGDGTWYATAQPGLQRNPYDGKHYIFSKLPS